VMEVPWETMVIGPIYRSLACLTVSVSRSPTVSFSVKLS
jgi:hypothetical protein